MKFKLSAFILLLFIAALFDSVFVSQDPAPPPPSEKPLYRTTGNEATLFGIIAVKGTRPKLKPIDMTADPACAEINHKREQEWLLTNDDKLMNAFVYVTGDPVKAHRFVLPDSEAALQQVNCQYAPRVLGLRVGQNLVITNRDPTQHNVHPVPKLNPEWNQTYTLGSPPIVKTFRREEALIPIKCNQHPWERAFVGVMSHRFFAVSNELGSYEIRGLPPGTYKFVAFHEAFDEQQMEITLVAGENRRIDFTFDLDNRH
jgi:hypothetical protein